MDISSSSCSWSSFSIATNFILYRSLKIWKRDEVITFLIIAWYHLNVVCASSPNTPEVNRGNVEDTQGVTGVQPLGGQADNDAVNALNQEKYQL